MLDILIKSAAVDQWDKSNDIELITEGPRNANKIRSIWLSLDVKALDELTQSRTFEEARQDE